MEGRFLIGPMAKLGWGTPDADQPRARASSSTSRGPMFAILGVLRMALPAEDMAILNLQVSFVGSVDFENGQLQFDASLFDSRVLIFTLTGDMAVRIYWKDNAEFPADRRRLPPRLHAAADGPRPRSRALGIVIFQGNPNVRAEAYFAVTSNTVQFGARVELYCGSRASSTSTASSASTS